MKISTIHGEPHWYNYRGESARDYIGLRALPEFVKTLDTTGTNDNEPFRDAWVWKTSGKSRWHAVIRTNGFVEFDEEEFDSEADAKAWAETMLRLL